MEFVWVLVAATFGGIVGWVTGYDSGSSKWHERTMRCLEGRDIYTGEKK